MSTPSTEGGFVSRVDRGVPARQPVGPAHPGHARRRERRPCSSRRARRSRRSSCRSPTSSSACPARAPRRSSSWSRPSSNGCSTRSTASSTSTRCRGPGEAIVTVRFYVGEDRENSLVKLYNKISMNVDVVPPGVTGWVVKPIEIDDVPMRERHALEQDGGRFRAAARRRAGRGGAAVRPEHGPDRGGRRAAAANPRAARSRANWPPGR